MRDSAHVSSTPKPTSKPDAVPSKEAKLLQQKRNIERQLERIAREKNTPSGLRKQNEHLKRELAKSKADSGKVLGLKWYWWVLIVLLLLLACI
jgi:hypothetical protein